MKISPRIVVHLEDIWYMAIEDTDIMSWYINEAVVEYGLTQQNAVTRIEHIDVIITKQSAR